MGWFLEAGGPHLSVGVRLCWHAGALGGMTGSFWLALLLCTLARGFCRHDLYQRGKKERHRIMHLLCRIFAGAGLRWRRTEGIFEKNRARNTSAAGQVSPGLNTVATRSPAFFHMKFRRSSPLMLVARFLGRKHLGLG